jgi:hypothetical protein
VAGVRVELAVEKVEMGAETAVVLGDVQAACS